MNYFTPINKKSEYFFRFLINRFILITVSIYLLSCNQEKLEVGKQINLDSLYGYVQKGPFVNGTQITVFELDSKYNQSGKSFVTEIEANDGSFNLTNMNLSTGFVKFSATGFYFDETKGQLSESQLALTAITDLADRSNVNVNILTHLESRRIEYLLENNLNLKQAKEQAHAELMVALGLNSTKIGFPEDLNILDNNESAAALLAVSSIFQTGRNVGELTELLSFISNDLKPDGKLDDADLIKKIRMSAKMVDFNLIKYYLKGRYDELGIENQLPDFKPQVDAFLIKTAPPATIPVLQTTAELNYGTILCSVTLVGDDISANNSDGIVWSFNPNPTINDNVVRPFSYGDISFTSYITNLELNKTYYVRPFASNSAGTGYGSQVSFTVTEQDLNYFNPDFQYAEVLDIDGNVYKTIDIGTQTWMAENLRVTHYSNGDAIIETTLSDWTKSQIGSYILFNNEMSFKQTYGNLYNWYAASDNRNLCPSGWRVPSLDDWAILYNYLGQDSWQKIHVGTGPNSNSSGFSGLNPGIIQTNVLPDYSKASVWMWLLYSSEQSNLFAEWWSTNPGPLPSYLYGAYTSKGYNNVYWLFYKIDGFPIRCLKN